MNQTTANLVASNRNVSRASAAGRASRQPARLDPPRVAGASPLSWLGLCSLLLLGSASPPAASPSTAPTAQGAVATTAESTGGESSADRLQRLRERAIASTQQAQPARRAPVATQAVAAPPSVPPAVIAAQPTTQGMTNVSPTQPVRSTPPAPPVRRVSPPVTAPATPVAPPVLPAARPTTTPPAIRTATQPVHSPALVAANPPSAAAAVASQPTSVPTSGPAFQFNYFETPWPDVIDDFSRMSGWTIVGDVKSVSGNLSYRDTRLYTAEEALFQINELLLTRTSKMLLDERERYLMIGRLADLMREIQPKRMYNTIGEFRAAKLAPHTMCLVVYQPPRGWPAIDVIDQFRPKMDDYYGTQVFGEALILTGMARDHDKFVAIVEQFVRDNPTPPSADLTWKTFALKNAKAADVQNTLRMMYPPVQAAPRPGEDPQAVEAKQINIVSDLKNNAILVKAKLAKVEEIARVIEQLDSKEVKPESQIRLIRIEQANPDEVANQLRQLAQKDTQSLQNPQEYVPPSEAESRKWDVFASAGSPVLIVVGGARGIERAEQLTRELDVPETGTRTERILLTHANPQEVVQAITPIMNPAGKAPGRPIVLTADPTGGAVLVSGREAQIAEIKKLIASIDLEPTSNEQEHTIRLERAVPTEIAAALTQVLQPQAIAGKGTPRPPPRLIGNDSGGLLIVRCRNDEWPRIEKLIRELDGEAPDSTPRLRTFRLEHADAAELAAMLNPMFQGVPPRKGQPPSVVKISADLRDNTLRVFAPQETIEKIAAMLPDLDVASEVGRVRVIRLEHADATEAATALNQMFAGPARGAIAPGQPAAGIAVKITSEPITNSLLVVASKDDLEQIEAIARQMDTKAESRKQMRVPVPIRHRPAAEVADALKSWSQPGGAAPKGIARPPLKIIPSGNTIILDGTMDQVMPALELIQTLDVDASGRTVKVYTVTDAEEAANALRTLLTGQSARPASVPGRPGGPPGGAPSPMAGSTQIYPDTYRNVLIVHAEPRDIPEIDKLVEAIEKEVETTAAQGSVGEWTMVQLEHRDAYYVALDLEDLYDTPGRKGGPEFREGANERVLMIKCKPREQDELKRMAKLYDVPDEPTDTRTGVKIITMKENVAPEELLRMLSLQFAGKTGRTLDIDTSMLNQGIEVIDIHAGEKSEEPRPAATTQPVSWIAPGARFGGSPLASPALVEALLAAVLGQTAPTSAPAKQQPKILVLPDGRVLIRDATDEDLKTIDDIIDSITKEPPPPVMKIFPIKFAPDVNDVAAKLEAIFNKRVVNAPAAPATPAPAAPNAPAAPGAPPGAPNPAAGGPAAGAAGGRDRRATRPQQAAAAATVVQRVRVTPDTRTRQLFIEASPSDFPLIIAVLRMLDVETSSAKSIRIFYLVNLEARNTAQLLREMLGLETTRANPFGMQGGRRFNVPGQQGGQGGEGQPGQPGMPPGQPGMPGQPGQEGVVETSAETTTITPDEQTNAILVSSTPGQIKLIESLINDLEKQPNNTQPVMRRVPLQFARASEVATIVKETARATSPGGGGQPGGGRGGRRNADVSVNADPRTNSVILAGPAKEVERVEKIVAELDTDTGEKGQVEIFTVKGDAPSMSTALREMYAKPAAGGATSDVSITADAATSTIIVRAPDRTRKEISEKIREMDARVTDATQIRTIKLTLADADTVAKKLTDVFQQRGSRGGKQQVKITGVSSIKSLLVQAPDDLFEEIEKHAQAMDTQPIELDIRAFKLKHAKAGEAVDKINALVQQVMATMRSGGGSDINLGMFAFTPDPLTNSIIVTGSPIAFVVMQKVVDQLDVPQSELVQREVRSYALNPNVNAQNIAANIQQLFAGIDVGKTGIPAPTVAAEPNSNIVLVTATKKQHEEIHEKIVKPILSQVAQEPQQYRVPLKVARSDEAANTLNNFFNQWRASRGNKPQDAIGIVPDVNSNMLLVSCNETTKKLFDEQLAAIDVASPGDALKETRTYQVRYADPNAVVNAINIAFQPSPGRGLSPRDVVRASADWSTGSVIVTASRERHEEIAKIVADLDKTTDATRASRIIEIVHGDAQDIATALTNIYNQKQRSRTGTPPVTISALQGSNKIVVNCSETELTEIKDLVSQIDQETGGRTVHTVTMPEAVKAKDVADSINRIYTGTGFGGKQGLKAESNVATNTLLVFATEKEFEKINTELIQKLSDVPPVGTLGLYRRKLKYAVADEVARTLNQFFRDKQGIQDNASRFFGPPPGGDKALEDRIAVTAETGSNMLIISCTEKTMETLDELIKEIDTDASSTAGNVLEMIALKHINADEALGILEEYLKVSTREREDPQAGLPWWARDPNFKQETKTVLVGDTRLKSVESSNAIIVVSKPESMARIREMIAKIDVPSDSPANQPRIISLRHGNATQIAGTLSKAFSEGQRGGAGKSGTSLTPVILAETVTNSIIVRASPADYALIERMIADLDGRMQGEQTDVQIIAMPGGTDVVNLAKTISKTLNEAEKNRASQTTGYKPDMVTIEADIRTSALVVSASKAKFEQVRKLAETLILIRPPSGSGVTLIRTQNPDEVKKLLEEIQKSKSGQRSDAGWRHRHAPERSPHAPAGALARAARLGPGQAALATALLATALAQAQPTTGPLVTAIRPAATQPGRAAEVPGQAMSVELSGAPLTIQAGPGGLIVIGTEEDRRAIESLVAMLDKDLPKPRIEYVELKNAQATALAKSLTDVYDRLEKNRATGGQPRPEDKVAFIADPRTNGLFVVATEAKLAEVTELVRKSDLTSSIPSGALRSFRLKNRRVRDVEPNLKAVIQMRLKQKNITDTSSIGIEKDEQTNTLFITGGEQDLAEVQRVIEQLDQPPPKDEDETVVTFGAADIMVVPLKVATAEKLAAALTKLIQDASQGKTPTNDYIRRLRVLDDQGNPIAELNIDGPTFIVGDPESNSVVAASTRKNLLVLREIIRRFDTEPLRDAVEVTVRALQFADATEVAEQLKKMLEEAKKLTARAAKAEPQPGLPASDAGPLVYNAVVTPDARTNTLVLAGRPEALKLLDGLVTKLDVRGLGLMPFEIVALKHASAASLEQVLDDLMKSRKDALPKGTSPNADKSETVVIKADPRAETLIIAARADRMAEIRELVTKLDIPATALVENIRTITLKNGSAADLSKKIDDLWTKRSESKQTGQVKLEKPAIVADERSNSLVVAASKGDFDAIKSLVDKLEALPFGPVADIRLVSLRFNSAKELAPLFKKLFDERAKQREGADGKVRPTDQVAIEADAISNTILVACSPENFELLTRKLAELDVENVAQGVAELFILKNVEAARAKKTIDDLFKDGLFRPGGAAADSNTAKERQKVTVALDDRSNTLIVSAAPENLSIIRKVVSQMDDLQKPWNLTNVRLFQLEHADAVKLAAQLQNYFKKTEEAQTTGGREKTELPITVIADERTNRLMVGGSKDGIARAESLIAQLDAPQDAASRILVYSLRDGSAAKIGPMLEAIFKDRNQPRGGGDGVSVPSLPVTIKVDETSNALVISASREDHVLLKNLVDLLDRRSNILDQVKLFPLKKARSEALKKILEELYKGSAASGGSGGGTSGGLSVAVTTDERTNAIVVAGPPGEMENIAKLVERLDSAEPIDEAQVGIFPLENADAKKTSELLKEIMASEGGGGGGGSAGSGTTAMSGKAGSMLISFMKTDPHGMETFYKSIRENVQVSFDERTNSVIVVAPPASVQLIKNLVKTLDDYKKRDVFVRVFAMRNADAQKTVELLEKIFAQDEGSEAQAEFQQGREIKVEGGASTAGGPTGLGGSSQKGTFGRPKTTFTADTRTNSVVVAGWPEDIDVAADIIDQLDSQDIRDRQIYVYPLQNSKSEDVVTALDSYFQKQEQILESQGEGLSESRKAEQKVSAVAHKETNQVILSFSPRYQTQVLDLVRQLDNPPPQVMIQVLLAEVTLDNRFELGLEYALQQLRFSEGAVAGPNGTINGPGFDVVGGTDLGAAASSGGLGGFAFTITGEDFNFLIRTLQSDSKLEVLQRPMIMCQDNQEGTINVGQSVPFLRGTQVTDNGQVNSQIEYQDIGVKLNVTPHINPDGFVYMKVKPEISQITPSTINVGNGIVAPIFSKRDAETTVVVKDGETVVIGGLITTSDQETESKVPVLGDMPGLGVLFRTTQRSKTKTELLIVLTPRVVRTVEDARNLSLEARDVTGLLTPEQKQSVLMNTLRVVPEGDSEIAPEEVLQERPLPRHRPAKPISLPPGGEEPGYGPAAPEYGPFAPVSMTPSRPGAATPARPVAPDAGVEVIDLTAPGS